MIKIHNGKEKSLSYQASTEVGTNSHGGGYGSATLTGYGDTEEEAVDELRAVASGIVFALGRVDYSSREAVAWDGTPVEEYLKKAKTR